MLSIGQLQNVQPHGSFRVGQIPKTLIINGKDVNDDPKIGLNCIYEVWDDVPNLLRTKVTLTKGTVTQSRVCLIGDLYDQLFNQGFSHEEIKNLYCSKKLWPIVEVMAS